MRRGFAVLALTVPLFAGLIGSAGLAQARPLPSETVMKELVLTVAEMSKASGYPGQLIDAGGRSCYDTDDGGRDCSGGAQPATDADWANVAPYPSIVAISGFPTTAAALKHWRDHNLKPASWNGETITIVTKTRRIITYTSVPADPAQLGSAWTSLKGKQGIFMASCGAASQATALKDAAECSRKVATALAKKVKSHRPRTSLG